METNFKSYLSKAGLSEAAIAVLEEEVVVTFVIFQSLREEHFERLLPRLKVGQHALLLKMWEEVVLDSDSALTELLGKKCIIYFFAFAILGQPCECETWV